MHKFEYRAPRFNVDVAVKLNMQQTMVRGRCRDISNEGMRLELCGPLLPDACGTISMTHRNQPIEIDIRVAHSGAAHDGVEFIYKSDSERFAVTQLVASLAEIAKQPRLVVIK